MTAVFERRFRVRFYECDGYGHVNHANYLRYMQEAAFDASAAVGYDVARYDELGCHWLVSRTGITYHRPLLFDETVAVKTWVADFRRATSRRRYDLRVVETGELAAEAYSDWVYLDSETLRPTRISAEMITAFSAEGLTGQAERRRYPDFPAAPPGVYEMRRRVRWSEIDPAGHVNNAAYMVFFEDAAMSLMADAGWSAARLEAQGLGIVAREFRIDYLAPALLNDELLVATWIGEVRRSSARRYYTISRAADGCSIARAEALWVWVDLQNGRPLRIPDEFRAAFAFNVAPRTGSAN